MKNYLLALLMMSPLSLLAQVDQTVNDITDILANKNLQNKENALALSKLEDQVNNNSCDVDMDKEQSCQGFANSLLPKGYKEKGWKTLFEIKYMPTFASPRTYGQASYFPLNLDSLELPQTQLNSPEELDAEVAKILNLINIDDPFLVKFHVILNQINNPDLYKDINDLGTKNTMMFDRLKKLTSNMNDDEFLRFLSTMAGYVDYNDDRAAFMQEDGAGYGVITPFEQIIGTNAGVCGDIHSMTAKIAEQRGWEAFTVGYALEGAQHVVTAVADPKNPDKLMIVNYGSYESMDLDNGKWINPTPTSESGWNDLGMQLRIFKNDDVGDPNGKMRQIATVPTPLGSFMNNLFARQYEINKPMPHNENYRSTKAGVEHESRKVKIKKDGDKIVDKTVGEGVVIYEGETDGAQIYGIAVSHDVYKDVYRWDEKQNKCVLKKNKYFSVGVAGSIINLERDQFNDTFYVYLNMKGGQILHIYQSENFQFKGVIGYELEGMAAKYSEGFLTADGNLSTFLGVVADFNKNGTKVHTALTFEGNVGLKNQNLMTDMRKYPSNLSLLGYNGLSLDVDVSHKINDKMTFVSDNNITMTRVGGRVVLSTGIINKNTTIMASYQGTFRPLPIGNTLQSVNLLQNFNNMDGFRLSVGQHFQNKKGTLTGSISGYGGITTSTSSPQPMAGASLKLNLNQKKRKPAAK